MVSFLSPPVSVDGVTLTQSGSGVVSAANMATKTIKGRTTAGTGVPEDLTPTQTIAVLNNASEFDTAVATAAKVAIAGAVKRAVGSSASGSVGTAIVDCQVAGGNQLVALSVAFSSAGSASTATITVTYSDATTSTLTTASNSAGVWSWAGGYVDGATPIDQFTVGKKVTRVQAVTAGTGTGNRIVAVSGLEVPL